jgi:nitrogen fixation protein FixH
MLSLAFGGGCGSGGGTSLPSGPPLFVEAGPPAETVTTRSGRLGVAIRWSPATPIKGSDAVQLTIRDAFGGPVDGLSVAVVPWMPAHGHGTVAPVITETAPGTFVANPVYLYMSGEWQLRMSFTGASDDVAIATVEIR